MTIDEREALRLLAMREMREPQEQARYLLQRELVRSGVLVENNSAGKVLADTGAVVEITP